jgi:hypothetical protein
VVVFAAAAAPAAVTAGSDPRPSRVPFMRKDNKNKRKWVRRKIFHGMEAERSSVLAMPVR